MHLWIVVSLSAAMGAVCVEPLNCSYLSLLEHLRLGPNNYSLSSVRPVRNWMTPTYATVNLFLYVIVEVNEKHQSLTTGVNLIVSWLNELLHWDPRDFCGITEISVPKQDLWRPEFSIMESIKAEPSYIESTQVSLTSTGFILSGEIYKIISTCKMDLYKFPFDTQQCKLTVVSFMNRITKLRLFLPSNSSDVTGSSLTVFQPQGEWDLVSIHVSKRNLTTSPNDVWDQLVYTITITRRSQLYVINFLVPILVFLALDLVSYFMNGSGGEKLGFKVTILLAISVLLLILHDILPSTNQETPLIGVFCTGVFLFVGCSIVETVTVSFLIRMASKCDAKAGCLKGDGQAISRPAERDGGMPDSDSDADRMENDTSRLRLMLSELQAIRTHMSPHHPEHLGNTCMRLKTVAKWINIVYFLLYICALSAFLSWVWTQWFH